MENQLTNVEWPSTRVPQGGIFHPPKVQYSKETHDLLRTLMEEAKLTMMQRKKINYHLRNGDSLPPPAQPESFCSTTEDENMQAYNIMMKAKNTRRRSLTDIKASGAYEKDKFVAQRHLREPGEIAKMKLQEMMSGIKEFPNASHLKVASKYKHKKKTKDAEDPVVELINEIYERADWLAEMEELGEGKIHRAVIQAQIAERLREIKRVENHRKYIAELENQQEKLKENIVKISKK